MDFGKSFKFYRQKANLTQKEAAEKIGIKGYQLGNYETNRSQPSLEILKKMSKVYIVSIDKMLGNHPLESTHASETKKEDYNDMGELLKNLSELTEQLNKVYKK